MVNTWLVYSIPDPVSDITNWSQISFLADPRYDLRFLTQPATATANQSGWGREIKFVISALIQWAENRKLHEAEAKAKAGLYKREGSQGGWKPSCFQSPECFLSWSPQNHQRIILFELLEKQAQPAPTSLCRERRDPLLASLGQRSMVLDYKPHNTHEIREGHYPIEKDRE